MEMDEKDVNMCALLGIKVLESRYPPIMFSLIGLTCRSKKLGSKRSSGLRDAFVSFSFEACVGDSDITLSITAEEWYETARSGWTGV